MLLKGAPLIVARQSASFSQTIDLWPRQEGRVVLSTPGDLKPVALDCVRKDDAGSSLVLIRNTKSGQVVLEVMSAEVVDEFGDSFRYRASNGSDFVPLEEEGNEGTEEAVEILPVDLLDELAAAMATA